MDKYINLDAAIKALTGRVSAPTDEEIEYTLRHILVEDVEKVCRCGDCAIQGKADCPMDEWVKPDENGYCYMGKPRDYDG